MSAWWKERVVYQIYPRSFMDSNGDGIGDIPGIISRLPYLQELGVGIIWLSPVYCSPNDDNGYDISDYRNIQPEFGTMVDMDRLILEAGKLDIKLVMDLVINHTSDEHQWFKESRNPQSPYRDYYIWRPGKNPKTSSAPEDHPQTIPTTGGAKKDLPNNWTSFFAEECWEYDPLSGEYYLHLFSKKQPDLNYRNPKVIEEIKSIMKFWLDKGISGFRCDVINVIYKTSLADGKKKLVLTGSEHYLSQPGAHTILKELRSSVLSNYDCFAVGETVFVTPAQAHDLCDQERGELDMIFTFEQMETDQWIVKWFKRKFRADRFGEVIAKWQQELEWPANYLENHDQLRAVSRFGNDKEYWEQSAKMLSMLLLSLKGTPYIFQGQEIGMTNFDFTSMAQVKDIESINVYALLKRLHFPAGLRWSMIAKTSRDNSRTPFQWNSSPQGGFTTGCPWLGVNKNYIRINMEAQQKQPDSILMFYREMIQFRANNTILKEGSFHLLLSSRQLFAYQRIWQDQILTVLLSFDSKAQTIDLPLPGKQSILIGNQNQGLFQGVLAPFEAVILQSAEV